MVVMGFRVSPNTETRSVASDVKAAGEIGYMVASLVAGVLLVGAATGGAVTTGYIKFVAILAGGTGVLFSAGLLVGKYGPLTYRQNWYILFGLLNAWLLTEHFIL